MIKHYFPLVLPCAFALLISGCTDDNYDLSNIDKTSQIPVNNLVVPVNVGPIALDQIIDIADDTENFEVQDNQYVFFYDGDFNSDKISIDAFNVARPENLEPTYFTIFRPESPANRKAVESSTTLTEFTYTVDEDKETSFTYNVTGVDETVQSVEEIQTFNSKGGVGSALTFTTSLNIPSAMLSSMEKLVIEKLVVQFPSGLYVYNKNTEKNENPVPAFSGNVNGTAKYDASTGYLTITDTEITSSKLELTLTADVINTSNEELHLSNGAFDYSGQIVVKEGGVFKFTPNLGVIPPLSYEMTSEYDLSSFDILGFTGEINYDLDDIKFDNVELKDLPDFLTQDGTNIALASPQLYLALNNSCYKYNLGGETGLTLTSYRNGVAGTPLVMDEMMTISPTEAEAEFAISPQGKDLVIPASVTADYPNITTNNKLLFSDFGQILEGNGIPQEIAVDLSGAKVDGEAKKFPLLLASQNPDVDGVDGLSGKYRFRAPLQLGANSQILYSSTTKEWDSEALQDLHVNSLNLKASVASNVPVNVKLGIIVYDVNGNKVGKSASDLEVPAMIADTALDFDILPCTANGTFDSTQEITGIDKIEYTVTAFTESAPSSEPLSPDQTLTLSQIRATIDGYYLYTDK